jgi:chromosome segregation protein
MEKRYRAAVEAEQHRANRQSHLEPERDRLKTTVVDSRRQGEALAHDLTEARAKLAIVLEQRSTTQESARQAEEKIRACQRASQGLSDTLHKAELARARAETKRTNAVERLLVEYGLRPEEVERTEVPSDAPTLVNRLRKEIKEMGDVNLGAIDAFDRLNARYEELTGQADDIQRGKADVESSIRELDRLTRDRFVTTFKAVQEAFAQSFRQIFGDGEGVLELEEADNVLDSGVEISVQVPGKKRQRLELLSGGERALAAMAFLFALIRVKPTPLVVLDEIDAPLDGRNVERFIGIMRTLAESVQFILITHNPVTIESADVWFGVTMQEPGVSTLVPVKAPDRQVVRAVVPDAYLKG